MVSGAAVAADAGDGCESGIPEDGVMGTIWAIVEGESWRVRGGKLEWGEVVGEGRESGAASK